MAWHSETTGGLVGDKVVCSDGDHAVSHCGRELALADLTSAFTTTGAMELLYVVNASKTKTQNVCFTCAAP